MRILRFFACGFAFLLPLISASAQGAAETARAYRQQHEATILRDYARLLEIPNTPAFPEGLQANAEAIRDGFRARGIESELWNSPVAPPIVYARIDVPGAARTLGIYVHYDGQPADPEAWTHPPFEPALYTAPIPEGGRRIPFPEPGERVDPEWRLYARSAADDKAPIPAMFAALDALKAADRPLTSNLVFFFEGEEERGSPNLRAYMQAMRHLLADIDLWLICDGPQHQSRRAQLVFGVRGITTMDVTVYGADRGLHSGHYGNWAPNPAMRLAQLLASMKEPDGRVTIEGFYSTVDPLTAADREVLQRLPSVDEQLRGNFVLAATEEDNAPLNEQLLKPGLNVRGLRSGAVGRAAASVIPVDAEASIDLRLVKGNDPAAMVALVERHIEQQGYRIVREDPDPETRLRHSRIAKVLVRPGYPAVRTPVDLPVVQPIIRAAERAAGEPVLLIPTMGGSLPLYLFTDFLEQPMVIVPIVNHDNNQHAPDENLRIGNLWYGIDLFAELFTLPASRGLAGGWPGAIANSR